MISIIVLTYNQEKYIANALDSILMQQVDEPIEIIIGDDHSLDHTSTICSDYQKKHPNIIRHIYNKQNLGLVENFIKMIQLCKGEYLALCDGDDYWIDERKLLKQVEVLRKEKDIVLVHTSRNFHTDSDDIIKGNTIEQHIAESPQQLLFSSYICVPTVMCRMNAIQKVLIEYKTLYDKYKWKMQDYPLWLLLGLQGRFRYIPDITANYRVLNNSLSREIDKKRAYQFDLSVIEVRTTFYIRYLDSMNKTERFRFKEMEFHARKRMLLDYPRLAWGQYLHLIGMLPILPHVIYNSIKRKLQL